MDLPTCPSCGQSVLEDDAVDCPFCGASMKGGAPSRTPPKPPAKPTSTTAKPSTGAASSKAPAKTAGRSAAAAGDGARTPAVDDDPFAVTDDSAEKAIPLRRKPFKGALKAVCPMCETAGYAPLKAAGHEVRCANPQCLVPIFTAPEPPKKEPENEAPSKTSAATWALLACVLLLVVAVGGVAWYFVLREDPTPSTPGGSTGTIAQRDPVPLIPIGGDTDAETATKQPPPTTAKPLGRDEIRSRALTTMIENARETRGNRSKPFCRRLTAEAFALTGDLDEARKQVDQLQKVGPNLPFYQVSPLTMIAWREFAAGRDEAARQTVEQAAAAGKNLLTFGREPLDAATQLAAALTAAGRDEDAVRILRNQRQPVPLAMLVMQLQTIRAFQTYDLPALTATEALVPPTSPHWSTAAVLLGAHGRWQEGLKWVERQESEEERTDGVIAWAEAGILFAADQSAVQGLVSEAAGRLKPEGQAKLHARLAMRHLGLERTAAAEAALEAARSALESVSIPEPAVVPEMKQLYTLKLPNPVPLRTAALAAAEIARAEALLGRREAAWASLERALAFLRGMAPSPTAIGREVEQVETAANFVRDQLATALGLDTEDKARRAFNNYRKQVTAIAEAANARFQLQTRILAQAAQWDGIREPLGNEIRSRQENGDGNQQEPYDRSAVPTVLAAAARSAGETSLAGEVETVFPPDEKMVDPEWQLQLAVTALMKEGKYAEAAGRIEKSPADRDWKLRLALLEASRLVKAGQVDAAYQFTRSFQENLPLREEAYELVSALASRLGEEQRVWKTISESKLLPTEYVAAGRGLIAGMVARGSTEAQSTAAR